MGGPRVALADGPGTPTVSPASAMIRLGRSVGRLVLGWTTDPAAWLDELALGSATTVMGGYALRRHVERGAVRYLPVRLAATPRLLMGPLRPDVTLVRGVPRGSGFCFADSVSWGQTAARQACDGVVVLVEPGAADLETPMIEGDVVGVVETDVVRHPVQARTADPALAEIARFVREMLPDEPTLQTGPGAVAEAVLGALDSPVRVWTGLATEGVADLADSGLLRAPAVATYVAGGDRVRAMAADRSLHLRPIEETHTQSAIHQLPRFVAVNTALQVGLDGSVNVESIGGRHMSGVGGHPDFCAAAATHPDGLSVVALRSEHGGRSTLVDRVERVSTPGCDVDLVVTEHGIADLRGADAADRARRIAAVAAPSAREELLRAAACDAPATCCGHRSPR